MEDDLLLEVKNKMIYVVNSTPWTIHHCGADKNGDGGCLWVFELEDCYVGLSELSF